MKKVILFFILIMIVISIHSFEIRGNPAVWQKTDLIGFDDVADCSGEAGDISSVFSRYENDKFFLRITFTDMIRRQHNLLIRDNFQSEKIFLTIPELGLSNLDISSLNFRNNDFHYLRTPENNLIEFAFEQRNKPDKLTIDVTKDGLVIDSFDSSNCSESRGGNCAFIHHGNQGLTYTEVFYGQYPNETSGFDEILEVHQATDIPGNFHMSGTLIPAAQWHNPEFNEWLYDGADEGYVSMMTSALGQHIMPFLQNNMNDWSVAVETDMVDYRYNYFPKIAWIPERVWLTPGVYPEAGVTDWLGDNWTQHGVEAVVLDDSPHCDGHSNYKIHWMNNNNGINLRIIPINNEFVGNMHYDAGNAMNQISNTGQYGLAIYGTDWEVAAEMNQHNGTFFLDNYESVLWYCHDNYPAVNVWKLDDAILNSDFNGEGVEIVNGTYYLLGGYEGYGYANNSWYTNWASSPSHSDFHQPVWDYGYIWNNTYENLLDCPDNTLAQLGWYTLMINLHETGWHDEGQISGWEHRYSSHIKNANVYAEASRWANGDFIEPIAAYEDDIDRDGIEELIIHNERTFFVFEHIGGKANWVFAKDENNMYSVVGSDVAYFSETEGDYNESSNNHFAALSEVNPNFQHDDFEFEIVQAGGDEVEINLTKDNLIKNCKLLPDNSFLEVNYSTQGNNVMVGSGWTPDQLDIIWNGKDNLQRMWGENGTYCGRRNSASGATAAFVLGSAGAAHNTEFEGTLVMGDEIQGANFTVYLYAGYTSSPYDPNFNQVEELDALAAQLGDETPPSIVLNAGYIAGENKLQITFDEPITASSAQNIANYELPSPAGFYTITSAVLTHQKKVTLTIAETFQTSNLQAGYVSNIEDVNGNVMPETEFDPMVVITPHLVGTFNNWDPANHDYDLELADNGIWKTSVQLAAGTHTYKVLEADDWVGFDWPSSDQIIELAAPTEVDFMVNCGVMLLSNDNDQYVFHSTNPPVVCGSFLSELGGIDWNEQTTLTQMNDDGVNGDIQENDGTYTFQTEIPAGNYTYKIVLNNNWDQNTTSYNLLLNLSGNSEVIFYYDMIDNFISAEMNTNANEDEIISTTKVNLSNYPNPFNPSTTISFNLSNEQNEQYELVIYNIKGQKVRTLECINRVDTKATESLSYSVVWNGKDSNDKPVSSGIYFYRLVLDGKQVAANKMMLLK